MDHLVHADRQVSSPPCNTMPGVADEQRLGTLVVEQLARGRVMSGDGGDFLSSCFIFCKVGNGDLCSLRCSLFSTRRAASARITETIARAAGSQFGRQVPQGSTREGLSRQGQQDGLPLLHAMVRHRQALMPDDLVAVQRQIEIRAGGPSAHPCALAPDACSMRCSSSSSARGLRRVARRATALT